ncbi:MAG TPA: 50S ribosomal protein L4 [Candidatus Absconditabacterales bacterium]|nr:50S ribosomal protein L4 [Candidatus Absconditabacterales bacterium]HNG96736.1 50S ribosomal protein L4 [Candidatus Absconditabacterales bacterium]
MSYTIPVLNTSGKNLSSITLDATVFAQDKINSSLIHEYVLMQLANARQSNAHSKTRGEVSFSGKKIYKQKKTGNARTGDKGSPLRKKGGVAFGPSSEYNWSKTMTKKQRKLALLGAFVSKLQNNEVVVIDGYSQPKISTKGAYSLLKVLNYDENRNLVMSGNYDEYLSKSFRNIEDTKYVSVDFMNVVDLLKSNRVMILGKDSLEKIIERFTTQLD